MEEAFGRARFTQHLKTKGIDVNKMHSDNVKDAEAAKKRAATAQSDLDSFRKRTGVTSESSDDFEPHMMYDPKTGKGTMAKVEADHIRMKKMGYSHDKPDVKESVDDLTGHTRRRLATIIRNPSHPMHSAAKAEMDRRNMTRESFKTFVEATYTDSGWQKPKKDTMSDADGMKKAKKLAKNAVILTKSASAIKKPVTEVSDEMKARYIRGADASHRAARSNEREAIAANKPEKAKKFKDIMKKRNAGMAKAFGEGVTETKGAPKGYHFTRDGKLKKGDAGADGDGGAKLRSDPLDKQRSKIPPIPEKFANPAQQAAVMAKLKKSGKYDGKEATIPDGQTVMTKKDPVKKNDMDKLAKIRMMLDREKKK